MKNVCSTGGILLLMASAGMAGTLFSDGFEGAAINPFWNVSGPGTATLTNSLAQAGSQSVQLTLSPTFPWEATLSHSFSGNQYGSVSVYMDVPVCCGFSAAMEIDSSNGDWIDLERVNSGATDARISIGGQQTEIPINFSAGPWQLLEISTSASGVIAKLNGTTVLADSRLTTFNLVHIQAWGGPSGMALFDTFNANTTDAAPEPASFGLAAGAMGAIIAVRRFRNRPIG